ncbi:transcription factor grauzone-like [Anopheles cruzii]|uniref:transcription factor grauzone-like n=1 Tax=Anopheles cruzii TaxID=68878 RepID=UPI0022EC34F4|nr:transcription factor grauzone-like [Anopheles cruzii]
MEVCCRLCLYTTGEMIHIFDERACEAKVCEKLQVHLSLSVKKESSLPKHICLKCWQRVEAFEEFYREVADNQVILAFNAQPDTIVYQEPSTKPAYIAEEITYATVAVEPIASPVSENGPPSYDEVQQSKVAHRITIQTVQEANEGAEEPCYVEVQIEEADNRLEEEPATEDGSDRASDFSDHDVDTVDIDEESADNTIIIPKLLQDGKFVVRGEQLRKYMEKFYDLECDICNHGEWQTIEELFDHYRTVHNTAGYVECCGRKMRRLKVMATHMATHVQPEAFECPICRKIMTSQQTLRLHIKNHLPEEKRPLQCSQCPRRFSYSSVLAAHQASHQSKEQSTLIVCAICDRSYRSTKGLQEHMAAVHSEQQPDGSGPAVCHICAKQFSNRCNLAYHMTTHQPPLHQVQCEECGKWLKNKICLRKHMIQHSQIRHQCEQCDYSAVNVQCLQNHIRVKHSNKRPYVCGECGKAFKLKTNLQNHLVQHTGVHKYACEFCSRKFASSGNYYVHRKRMHSEELARHKKQKEEEEREFRERTILAKTKN